MRRGIIRHLKDGEKNIWPRTGVEVLNKPCKLLLALFLGYSLWVDLPFFDEPGVEFGAFVIDTVTIEVFSVE